MKARSQRVTLLVAAVVFVVLGLSRPAAAEPITYLYEGTGSGTIGSSAFSNASFTITALANTDNIALWAEGGNVIQNTHSSANILIAGQGSFTILTPSHTWSSNAVGGFTSAGLGQALSANWVTLDEPSLFGYDLATPIGPILETFPLHVGQFEEVATTGGLLRFAFIDEVTFTAIIPEPSSLILAGMALVALVRRAPTARSRVRGATARI
jgi:hypothetical protein